MSDPTLAEINKKLDKLLKYQRRQQIFSWIRWGLWTLLFIIFVIVPVFFAYDVIKNPGNYIDITMLNTYRDQIEQIKSLLE